MIFIPEECQSTGECPEKKKVNVVHRNVIKTMRHLLRVFTHSNPLFLYLKNWIWYFNQKANYLESLFGKFIKVQQIFNSSCILENLNCLWSGWINETSASNVPLGDTLSKGSSQYTVQHHLTLVQPDNIPNLSRYCGSSPSLSEVGIHWK